MLSRGLVVHGLTLFAALLALGACSHPERGPAVPDEATWRAEIPGIPNARFRPAERGPAAMEMGLESIRRERAHLAETGGDPDGLPPVYALAVSGGGEDGAFGAGLLVGWTEAGTRPEFKLVTGVSTGALTAPFAFLGPEYDDELEAVYTQLTPDDIFEERGLTAALFDDAMSDTAPLRRTIRRYADEEMLRRIAEEYRKGRLLLIASTDIDARQAVVWNIGAIAESGAPGALDLFHHILVASAAVPGVFPPVMIDVEVDGRPYQEMHVDGGAVSQVFGYPRSVDMRQAEELGIVRDRTMYIIRNSRLDADWASTDRQTLSIAGRAISSLIHSEGVGDLQRMYLVAQRDGVGYNLAFIGDEFDVPLEEPFDQTYMRALFAYGRDLGRNGYPWHHVPPGYHEAVQQ